MTDGYLLQCQAAQYVAGDVKDETFTSLLDRIAGRFPSRAALAKALAITPSRLSRAMNTGDFPLNVANCLRLAQLSDESPTEVLRAAGKADVADLIESLYGREAEYTTKERELLAAWRALSPRAQESLRAFLSEQAKAGPPMEQPSAPAIRRRRRKPA